VNAEQDMGFGISTLLASTAPSASSLKDKLPALNFSGPSKLPLSAIPDVSDDDEDMPDIDTVLKLASEQSKKKKLSEAKAAALKAASATRARAPASANVDSDSDLEITGGPSPSKKKSVNMNISVDGQPGPLRLASGTAPAPLPKRPENDRRPTRPTPAVPTSLSFASSKPGVGNGKSKPKSKGKQQPLTAKEINEETLRRAQESADAIRRQKEEDWVRRGGKVKETTVPEPVNGKDAIARYAEQARKNLENQSLKEFDNEGGTDDDGSDEEYQPELQLSGEEENDEAQDGSPHVSPSLSTIAHPGAQQSETEPDEEENDENTVPLPRRSNVRARIAAIVDSDDEAMTENDENLAPAPTPRNRNGHVLVPNSTLREGQFNINAFSRTMSDVSEEVEPDEDDKENNNMLAFEGDKENMSVVMGGSPTPRRPALGSLVGTSTRSLSSSDSLDRDASQSRTPLRELSVRKDVFGRALHDSSESPTRQGGSPFERKLRASQSPSKSIHDSPSRPQLLSKKLALSQFMDDNTQPAPAVKKGGLSQFMENTQPSLLNRKVGLSQFMDDSQPTSALLPRSGLMDAFDDDFDSPGAGPSQPQTGNDAFGRLRNVEAPSLTFDESIRPAVKLDLSEREREQAEAIFAKEQEMLIEDSMAPVATQAPLLWENTQGYVF
jgi:mediator of replication checkpoint protein 1